MANNQKIDKKFKFCLGKIDSFLPWTQNFNWALRPSFYTQVQNSCVCTILQILLILIPNRNCVRKILGLIWPFLEITSLKNRKLTVGFVGLFVVNWEYLIFASLKKFGTFLTSTAKSLIILERSGSFTSPLTLNRKFINQLIFKKEFFSNLTFPNIFKIQSITFHENFVRI